jgi:hypothetical protein
MKRRKKKKLNTMINTALPHTYLCALAVAKRRAGEGGEFNFVKGLAKGLGYFALSPVTKLKSGRKHRFALTFTPLFVKKKWNESYATACSNMHRCFPTFLDQTKKAMLVPDPHGLRPSPSTKLTAFNSQTPL